MTHETGPKPREPANLLQAGRAGKAETGGRGSRPTMKEAAS